MDGTATPRIALLDGFTIDLGEPDPPDAADDQPHAAQRVVAHLALKGRSTRTATAGQLWLDRTEERAH